MSTIWEEQLKGLITDGYTSDDRRNLIRSQLRSMIRFGLNQTQSHKIFKDAGVGINNADYGNIYNELKDAVNTIDFLTNNPQTGFIDEQDLEIDDYDFEDNYRVVFGISSIDPDTGIENFASFGTTYNWLTDIESMIGEAIDLAQQSDTIPLFAEITNVKILRAYRNPYS